METTKKIEKSEKSEYDRWSAKRQSCLRLAVQHMPESVFLDSYWKWLASAKEWITEDNKIVSLRDMSETDLYNVRQLVMEISGFQSISEADGTVRLVGLITSIMNKKANTMKPTSHDDLPF